ncbi:hypothetical protein PIROE2DRAFT_62197 [Piromyces sp. E2]|nr:hypothetical protein PIROE2DRAFT_62197 [Piromyces sp. E2]|eukprot:OUM61964.1 hypothetical protein PIROE2DRAFT_62197 [Piromyces sp. E2]
MANGYYIGCTKNNCDDLDNIYICEALSYDSTNCQAVPNEGAVCASTLTFAECYNYKGKYVGYIYPPKMISPFGSAKSKVDVIVNANDSSCYFGAYGNKKTYTGLKKRGVQVPRTASRVLKINGRCLVGAGWCPCQDYVQEKPKPNPSSSSSCTSYSCKRCQRKLPSVKWKRSDGWTTPLNNANIIKYCAKTTCQEAYNDEKKPKCDRRDDYWRSCRKEILGDLKSYYKKAFEPVSSTVNYC